MLWFSKSHANHFDIVAAVVSRDQSGQERHYILIIFDWKILRIMRKLILILIIFGNLIIYDGNDLYFLWDLMMAVFTFCGISYTAYTWSKLSFGLFYGYFTLSLVHNFFCTPKKFQIGSLTTCNLHNNHG